MLATYVHHMVRLPFRWCHSQINGRTAKDPGSSSARATAHQRSLGVHQALSGPVRDTGELMCCLFMLAAPADLIRDPDRAMILSCGPQNALRLVKDCLETSAQHAVRIRSRGEDDPFGVVSLGIVGVLLFIWSDLSLLTRSAFRLTRTTTQRH